MIIKQLNLNYYDISATGKLIIDLHKAIITIIKEQKYSNEDSLTNFILFIRIIINDRAKKLGIQILIIKDLF